MAKTKTTPELVSDTALEIIVWPAKVKLRCDHAGIELPEGHEPDIHEDPSRLDAEHLVRDRYERKCDRFGHEDVVDLRRADDPARCCPSCSFYRTLVAVA